MNFQINSARTGKSIAHTPPALHTRAVSEDLKRSRIHSPLIRSAYLAYGSKSEEQSKSPAVPTKATMKYGDIAKSALSAPNTVCQSSSFNDRHYNNKNAESNNMHSDDAEREKRLSNSTSSIFASSTLSNPDADQIILCMSAVLQIQMEHDTAANPVLPAKFNFLRPNSTLLVDVQYMKLALGESIDDIYNFIHHVYSIAKFSPECCIISLVYINRLVSSANFPLHSQNWRPLLLASMILAQKVWDDKCLATSSFAKIVPLYSKSQVLFFERRFLELLKFNAVVKQCLYARYYFELRDLFVCLTKRQRFENPLPTRTFTLQPLSLWRAKQLELYSDSFNLRPQPKSNNEYQAPASFSGHTSDSVNSTPSITLEDLTYTPKGRFVHS